MSLLLLFNSCRRVETSISVDGDVAERNNSTFDVNAIVKAAYTTNYDIDGIIIVKGYSTLSVDGSVRDTSTTLINIDGSVAVRRYTDFTIDAIVLSTTEKGIVLDGFIVRNIHGHFNLFRNITEVIGRFVSADRHPAKVKNKRLKTTGKGGIISGSRALYTTGTNKSTAQFKKKDTRSMKKNVIIMTKGTAGMIRRKK